MMRNTALIGAALLLSFAAQAAVVSWDGTSTDITSLTANVNATGADWADADTAWDTTDIAMAAQGDQAALKLAMSQMQQTHKTAQINAGQDSLFIGGGGNTNQLAGGLPKVDVTAGFSQLYAFDVGSLAATDALTNLSVTVRERDAADVCSFRWFVVSDGTPYVSATNNADVGATRTTYTLADPASETWYAFDGSTNLEAAVGSSVGALPLTNVTYAGVMTIVDTPADGKNWHGMYIYQFFATTDGAVPNQPPVADPQSVEVMQNKSVNITLAGSDTEGSNLTYTVESLPTNGVLTGTAPDLTYTPDTGYTGPDSFTFTVNDGETNSEPATVSITVNPNNPPVADAQDVIVEQNSFVDITLTGSDPEGSNLTYFVESDPTNGVLTGTAPDLTYTPNTDYAGPDSFTFTVNDGDTNSAPATVSITVYEPPTGGLYFEDFSTDPGYTNNNLTIICVDTNVAGSYFTFGEYAGTPDIGVTTDTGVLHIDSNTAGGSARSRGLTVFIDTSAAGIGSYTVSFDVTNWVAGTGTAGFKVAEGNGLDTGYLQVDNSDNNAAANVPKKASGTATWSELDSTWGDGTQGTGISSNGTVSLEIFLSEAGRPGDYLALAWVQVRSTATATAPTFDVDNVWVGVGDPPDQGDAYDAWAFSYGLTGDDADENADVENGGLGDGLDNLMEYALGGDPTVDDAATVGPATLMALEGGTNWFYHVYDERTDDAGLSFTVGATPDLVGTPADTNDVERVGETPESGGFKTVTNRTEVSSDAKFIKLEVSK
jgi:hypothetical protein